MDSDAAPRPASGAKSMLLTVLGEFVLRSGRPVWTTTLVSVLASLGFNEKNARQAIARLAEQDLLSSERIGRQVRWHLTARAEDLLVEGTERIFGFLGDDGSWDGQWLVLAYSVPEELRQVRPQLRKTLGFAGFGFPAQGIAVCAHAEREADAKRILDRLGVSGTCLSFRGQVGLLADSPELVRRSWDLQALGGGYLDFIAYFERLRPTCPAQECAAVTELVHWWRRFPFTDPELPDDLLPAGWPGHRAKRLFDRLHGLWLPAAMDWVDGIDSSSDGPVGGAVVPERVRLS